MFDTFAMVGDIRDSIARAVGELCHAYSVYLELLGEDFDRDYTISFKWGDELTKDASDTFANMLQAEQTGAVSKAEIRSLLFPGETSEQAEAAVARISAQNGLSADPWI